MKKCLLVCLATCLLTSCARPKQTLQRPSWLRAQLNIQHPDYILVIGFCLGQGNINSGIICAKRDASSQIRKTYMKSGGLVRDYYYEVEDKEVQTDYATKTIQSYNVWLLMALPKIDLRPKPNLKNEGTVQYVAHTFP